jgi:hypothetical protein
VLKVVFFIRRRGDMTLEAFREHYERVHVKLSFDNLPLLRKHARNYVIRRKGQTEPDYDCITECWFDDWEALKQTSALIDARLRELIAEDEARFMDRESIRSIIVEEQVTLPEDVRGAG